MSENLFSGSQATDDRFQTLINNTRAAAVVSQIVEGTLGAEGMDIMMIDRLGDVVITNDGATILQHIEAGHPAARMIINAAQAQQIGVGDGTTTTTIMASALVAEGAAQVIKGVPVNRVVEGINTGVDYALKLVAGQARPLTTLADDYLFNIALVAGRGQSEIAYLIVKGARLLGRDLLLKPDYRFSDAVMAIEAAENQVFNGVIIKRPPLSLEMPRVVSNPLILVIDTLAPEDLNRDAMKTEAGFNYYLNARDNYEANLRKILDLGVKLVVVDRAIDDIAVELFTQTGIMAVERCSSREIDRLCRHTGAKKIKRSTLNRNGEMLRGFLGRAASALTNDQMEYIYINDGCGENHTTIIVGAATGAVADERERIARDGASAVQAAVQGGIVPGGGALEVWLAGEMEKLARDLGGMTSYGVLCVKEAFLKPFACMATNAGFNPLEKLSDVIAAQSREGKASISFDSSSGQIADMLEQGIVDPAPVKMHGIRAAAEVATAILRINTIIKKKNEEPIMNSLDILD